MIRINSDKIKKFPLIGLATFNSVMELGEYTLWDAISPKGYATRSH
ncbi:hypothetical protein [Moorena sp. SIO3H5]|nr:hypothetical protein [Moorena sp. SIO3H5]NEO70749.1 hypothetical protein [Moorena sp. SIO3H5]